jgi:acylphosphatase
LRQLHAVVHGRVQGVSFRYNAQHEAQRQGLVGWVRNLSDGTVETLAVGPDDRLTAYASWLQMGPPGARVTKVDITWADTAESFMSFEITYGSD